MTIASTVSQILSCIAAGTVPVGVDIGLAIQAHQQSPGGYTLRAVILACTPDVVASRRQLDYLTALPESAWEPWLEHTAQDIRDETLAAISRSIAWQVACV